MSYTQLLILSSIYTYYVAFFKYFANPSTVLAEVKIDSESLELILKNDF